MVQLIFGGLKRDLRRVPFAVNLRYPQGMKRFWLLTGLFVCGTANAESFERFVGKFKISKCTSSEAAICRLKTAYVFNDALGATFLKLERTEETPLGMIEGETRAFGLSASNLPGVKCQTEKNKSTCTSGSVQQKVEFVTVSPGLIRLSIENSASSLQLVLDLAK